MSVGIKDWWVDIARGGQSGASLVNVFGMNPDVDTGTDPEDVWDSGSTYNFTASGGATYYISSSHAGDTIDVTLTVLSENASGDWTEESFAVTLVGQTKTAITTTSGDDPVRLISIVNNTATALQGDVYVYEDSAVALGVPSDATKIRGKINLGNERTLMAIYTIPTGKTGYLVNSRIAVATPTFTVMTGILRKRASGGLFMIVDQAILKNDGQSVYAADYRGAPIELAAKTDIMWRAHEVGADNTSASAAFELLLLG